MGGGIDDLKRYKEAELRSHVINHYFQMCLKTIKNPDWKWYKPWKKRRIFKFRAEVKG